MHSCAWLWWDAGAKIEQEGNLKLLLNPNCNSGIRTAGHKDGSTEYR